MTSPLTLHCTEWAIKLDTISGQTQYMPETVASFQSYAFFSPIKLSKQTMYCQLLIRTALTLTAQVISLWANLVQKNIQVLKKT